MPPMTESHFPPRSTSQRRATEWGIAPDTEPIPSAQVREPAAMPAPREQAVNGESKKWSSAPCTAAEGELIADCWTSMGTL